MGIYKGKRKEKSQGKYSRRKRDERRLLNFRSIDRKNQLAKNKSAIRVQKEAENNKNTFHFAKNSVSKTQKIKKNHISYILRRDPRRYRIIAFTQETAAKKIQIFIRKLLREKDERRMVETEKLIQQFKLKHALKVIRKYVLEYFLKKKFMKDLLIRHKTNNLKNILLIQRKFRAKKNKLKKLNISKFKENLYAFILGWKVRRIIAYLKSLPECREAIDYIRLMNDLNNKDQTDLFSQKIIEQFPNKVKFFNVEFTKLYEDKIWVKTLKSKTKKKKF